MKNEHRLTTLSYGNDCFILKYQTIVIYTMYTINNIFSNNQRKNYSLQS